MSRSRLASGLVLLAACGGPAADGPLQETDTNEGAASGALDPDHPLAGCDSPSRCEALQEDSTLTIESSSLLPPGTFHCNWNTLGHDLINDQCYRSITMYSWFETPGVFPWELNLTYDPRFAGGAADLDSHGVDNRLSLTVFVPLQCGDGDGAWYSNPLGEPNPGSATIGPREDSRRIIELSDVLLSDVEGGDLTITATIDAGDPEGCD